MAKQNVPNAALSANKGPHAAQPAKPGTPDAKGKKGKKDKKDKVEKVPHPLVGNKDEKIYPFEKAPSDHNPKKHQPLSRRDFKEDVFWLDYKIAGTEARLVELKRQRKDASSLGDKKSRQSKKRLEQLLAKQMEVIEALKAQGHDVDAILKSARVEAEKKLAEAHAEAATANANAKA